MGSPWSMTEAELLAEILERCDGRDLWPVRVAPERHNQRVAENNGFPDLMIAGPAGVIYRELKTCKGRYRMRPAQTTWRYRLKSSGQHWGIWTPLDLDKGRVDAWLEWLEREPTDTDRLFALVNARK